MISRRPLILAALAAAALPALAFAQSTDAPKPSDQMISMEEARRIAAKNGVARVEEIKLDDGQWKVEGRDSLGSEIEIKLRASDGTVVKMERERPASAKAGN